MAWLPPVERLTFSVPPPPMERLTLSEFPAFLSPIFSCTKSWPPTSRNPMSRSRSASSAPSPLFRPPTLPWLRLNSFSFRLRREPVDDELRLDVFSVPCCGPPPPPPPPPYSRPDGSRGMLSRLPTLLISPESSSCLPDLCFFRSFFE